MVARAVGVLCIAGGFVLGMHGLANPDSSWLRTALGLIVTGLVAQAYALGATIRHRRRGGGQGTPPSGENGPT